MQKISTIRKIFFPLVIVTALTIFFIIKNNPSILPFSSQGSFEYVRKGEELLEKGKYPEAIRNFERANEESPGNRDIEDYLIWAYAKYASFLESEKKYNDAIIYLTKSYGIRQDAANRQNLSIMHANRALEYARDDNWSACLQDLASARMIAEDSNNASRNLGITLFNKALEEYKAGNERSAMLFLKEASLVYENSRIFDFLGDIYYRKAELDRAIFFWEKAKALGEENRIIDEKISKALREKESAASGEIVLAPHFEIRADKALNIDKAFISGILEKAYIEIGKDLAYYPPQKTVVFLYPEEEFRRIFKLPESIRAFYDGNIRMPFPKELKDAKESVRYINHEYTHAVLSAKTNNNCPIWFSEGVSVWQEFKNDDSEVSVILPQLVKEEDISLSGLERNFREGNADMRAYYLLAYTVIRYLVDTEGIDNLRSILERMSEGRHPINAIDDELLLSEKELEKRWAGYVKMKYFKK